MHLTRRLAVAMLAAGIALSTLAVSGLVATSTISSADCVLGGNSTFIVTKAGTYAWAWRSGYTVLGGNYAYMRVGDSQTLSTPVDATSGTKFGVIGGKSYAYPSCHS